MSLRNLFLAVVSVSALLYAHSVLFAQTTSNTYVAACSSNATVTVGIPTAFMSVVRDADGTIIPGIPVVWGVGAGGFAVVSQTGVVTGIKPGTTSIAAVYGNVTDRICLVVKAQN